MRKLTALTALSTLILTSACAPSLESHRITGTISETGLVYALPMTQFEVTATWQIEACPSRDGDTVAETGVQEGASSALGSNTRTTPLVSLKVETKSRTVDDGSRAYVINPEDLQSWSNVTEFEAKWHEGSNMLASVNASTEDRTGPIIGNLVETAVTILTGVPVTALAAPGTENAAPPLPPPTIRCKESVLEGLEAARLKRSTLKTKTEELKAATEELAEVTAKVTALGTNVSEEARRELSSALTKLTRAQSLQTAAQLALEVAIRPISYKTILYWPQQSNQFSHGPIAVPSSRLDEWFEGEMGGRFPIVVKKLYLQIEAATSFGIPTTYREETEESRDIPEQRGGETLTDYYERVRSIILANEEPADTTKGLPYRLPAAGRLVVCTEAPCVSTNLEAVVASVDVSIAQLGQVHTLPFTSRTFGNNTFAVEFAPDGRLKLVRHGQSSAPGEVATGLLTESVGSIATALDPVARLTRQNERLAQLKIRADALAALSLPPIAEEPGALNAESALQNAGTATEQADIAAEEARLTLAE